LVARIGTRMTAHATAVGKVLLASQSNQLLRELYQGYDFPVRTEHTLKSLAELLEQLTFVRKRGFAFDREESTIGVQCVAAPIRDHDRGVVAAMSIGIPNDRLDEARLQELTQMLLAAAGQISRRLGWTDSLSDEAPDAYS
jgi:IclR family transcriptional regulator, KDG regulon repressor